MAIENVLLHGMAADQMLLNDALQHYRRARMVPRALGVDDRYRALFADAQTVGLRAVDVGQVQFRQAPLQILPGFEPFFERAALGLGLVAAEEDMSANGAYL